MEVLTHKPKMGAPVMAESLQDLCHRLLTAVQNEKTPQATGQFHLRNGVCYEIILRRLS